MSEQRETRNSLFKSSISINSIRRSATQFSKSLRRTSVIASQIEKTTRQRNIFNERSISKDNEYFRKRRENIRRKQREDELESSNITGVTKKEGNIVSRSTRGFLGRILDFFGIILIGWFVTKLPDILKAIRKIIGFINKAVGFLTNFLDGVKEFLTGIGDGVKAAIDSFPKFDFLNFQKESEKTLKDTENRARKLDEEFRFGFFNLGRDIGQSIADEPGVVEGGEVVIPEEEQGSVVMDDDSQSGTEEGGEIDDTSGKEQITAFKNDNQEEKLRIDEDLEQQKVIASLKKIDEQSNKIKNIINDKKDPLTAKVDNNMADFGPSGGGDLGGTGYEAGAFAESEKNKEKRKQYEASGFDDDDISTDDTSMGTPQPGDFYMTVGGQGNKQKFYYVLLPNGRIKGLGKNRKPDGGRKFSKNAIVYYNNNILVLKIFC